METQTAAGSPGENPHRKGFLVIATCGVEIRPRSILIDRKFHSGMMEYVRRLDRPLACVVRRLPPEQVHRAMDHVEVSSADLPYRVHTVSPGEMTQEDRRVVAEAVNDSVLAYIGGSGRFCIAVADLARASRVPYVAVTEYSLATELDFMRSGTPSSLRRVVRGLRLRLLHRRQLAMAARAAEVHANGYPTYLELARANPRRVLYFDTRALQSDLVPEPRLLDRLATVHARPPRLIFSGRYHPAKGALDVVKAGIALDRDRLDFRLDLYGTGPLKDEMSALVRSSGTGAKIVVHDAVPYRPDLVEVTREADLFLSGHVQGDPSCTYLETFACGTPIVGYANEMWSVLCRESGGGRAVPLGDHRALAREALSLLRDPDALRRASLQARQFAATNTMEKAWDLRCGRLMALAATADGN